MPSNCNLQSYSCFSHQLSLSTVRSKAVQSCLILSTCYEWKIYTFYSSYDWTSCVHSTDRVVEWKFMALVHSSFRVESCLVVLSVLRLSCTRGQNYCWRDKITCRVFKCISLAKTITWQQDSRGPFLLGLIWTFSVLREGVLKWTPQTWKSSITFCHFGSFFCPRMEIGEWSTWPCSPAFITIRFSLLFASVSWMVVYL